MYASAHPLPNDVVLLRSVSKLKSKKCRQEADKLRLYARAVFHVILVEFYSTSVSTASTLFGSLIPQYFLFNYSTVSDQSRLNDVLWFLTRNVGWPQRSKSLLGHLSCHNHVPFCCFGLVIQIALSCFVTSGRMYFSA